MKQNTYYKFNKLYLEVGSMVIDNSEENNVMLFINSFHGDDKLVLLELDMVAGTPQCFTKITSRLFECLKEITKSEFKRTSKDKLIAPFYQFNPAQRFSFSQLVPKTYSWLNKLINKMAK